MYSRFAMFSTAAWSQAKRVGFNDKSNVPFDVADIPVKC